MVWFRRKVGQLCPRWGEGGRGAGLCPRNEKSAGKSFNTRIRNGNPWFKATLVQSDRAGARTRSSYLRAQYHRPSARRGKNKATIAVAASMLVATWFMLRDGTPWNDLGIDFFDRRDPAKSARRLTRRLEALGYQVAITPASPPGKPPTQRQGPFPSSYPTPVVFRHFPSHREGSGSSKPVESPRSRAINRPL
jgi:hypothetical protein